MTLATPTATPTIIQAVHGDGCDGRDDGDAGDDGSWPPPPFRCRYPADHAPPPPPPHHRRWHPHRVKTNMSKKYNNKIVGLNFPIQIVFTST